MALGTQHTQTLTSLSSLCSPDEDSCQKFVPFVGVSVLRGQWAIGADRWGVSVNSPVDVGHHLTCLSLQVVKVGLVEQSFSASGESLGAHNPWFPSPTGGMPLLLLATPPLLLHPHPADSLFFPSGFR